MFLTTISAADFSYSSQLLEKEAATIAQKYKISDDNNFCLRVAKACRFIRESKKDLIERFPANKAIFKISKNNPDEFSIYLGRDRAGNIHFFINLGKNIPFKNDGHHKRLTHVIKCDDETIGEWVLAKMPLKDDLKKMMAENESKFLCMFPDNEELMQTDLLEILPTKEFDKQYIFMPYYELGSLEQAFKNYVFSNEERLQISLDIANAVLNMHSNNVAYRDIKPDNILLYVKDNKIRAKLTDFGLSNELRECAIFKLNASPYVFSPEMLDLRPANKTEIDREDIKPCDIWALGLTYYRMFFCENPYEDAYKASRRVKDHHKFKLAIEDWLKTRFPEPANKFSFQYLIYEMFSIDPQKRPNIEQVVERLQNLD